MLEAVVELFELNALLLPAVLVGLPAAVLVPVAATVTLLALVLPAVVPDVFPSATLPLLAVLLVPTVGMFEAP